MTEKERHIITETGKLYKQFGIKSITMDDVARKLGISKKTLYQYVNDKAELVEKVLQTYYEDFSKRLDDIKNKQLHPIDEIFQLSQLIRYLVQEFKHSADFDLKKFYPEIYRKYKIKRRNMLKDATCENLKRGLNTGIYRKEINLEIISNIQMVRIENLFETDLLNLAEVNTKDFFNEMLSFFVFGIANEKGRKYFENKINQ